MPEKNTGDGGGSLFNLPNILALITLLGGTFLISQRLSSDRPVASADKRPHAIGSQTLEARLWEDPFRVGNPEKDEDERAHPLSSLLQEISARTNEGKALLMPVMLPGGSYSEDRESRIRSRMAVVSALGRMGYAPKDAEHVGIAIMPWPTTLKLNAWKAKTNASLLTEAKMNATSIETAILKVTFTITNAVAQWTINAEIEATTNEASPEATGEILPTNSTHLHLYYEWYHPRVFYSRTPWVGNVRAILVIWLDDSFFEDDPLLRLPLFLQPLLKANGTNPDDISTNPEVRLIGPRRSSTLRAMLPKEFEEPLITMSPNLKTESSNILQHVIAYSSTASVMDEALVKTNRSESFRTSVIKHLRSKGFNEFHFFNLTDARLADEVFFELGLRNVNPATYLNHHLVLISESDTFYGRMLSLTYGATLARRQFKSLPQPNYLSPVSQELSSTNNTWLANFVKLFQTNDVFFPTNLHSFVYLRGLDGQTVGKNADAKADRDQKSPRDRYSRPGSFEELLKWRPDANKAEGQAQFDYLSRLGESIELLAQELQRSGTNEIKAIGIIGSDVYDTLLILQALRDRFPKALFFTTDLDARFWHPDERDWARNLIVVSSYGLTLHPDLQRGVAPFRDSTQTAQFAAVLAALGDANLTALSQIAPRRFEIGNRTAVDLSTNQQSYTSNQIFNPTKGPWLHPLTRVEEFNADPSYSWYLWKRLGKILTALLILSAGALWYFVRDKGFGSYLFETLEYSQHDLGGTAGASPLIARIFGNPDPLCIELAGQLPEGILPPPSFMKTISGKVRALDEHVVSAVSGKKKPIGNSQQRAAEGEAKAFIDLLNRIMRREPPGLTGGIRNTKLVPQNLVLAASPWKGEPKGWMNSKARLKKRFQNRQFLDAFLDSLSGPPPFNATLQIAHDARTACQEKHRIQRSNLRFLRRGVMAGVALAGLLFYLIRRDTFLTPNGEPFSITGGTSAWPGLILRMISTVLSVTFIGALIQSLRIAFFNLTRDYYLPLRPVAGTSNRPGHVCASELWEEYQKQSEWWKLSKSWESRRRLLYTLVPFLLYLGFGIILFSLLGFPFSPIRGDATRFLDCFLIKLLSFSPFLFLSFLTIDAACLCRRFIMKLSASPTDYPETTLNHFRAQRGNISKEFLDEWIDVRLIADLTEQVGRLLWFPSIVFLVTLAARNQFTDHWPWSFALIIIFTLNFSLAIISVIILQLAARKAKRDALDHLGEKIKRVQASLAATASDNDAAQAKNLLDEIERLHRGAFARPWENPVFGAILLPSGATVLIQFLMWFNNR